MNFPPGTVRSQCISERSTDIRAVSVNIVCRVKAGKEGEEALISPTRNRRTTAEPTLQSRSPFTIINMPHFTLALSLPPAGLSGRSAARARPPIARGVTCKASEMSPMLAALQPQLHQGQKCAGLG